MGKSTTWRPKGQQWKHKKQGNNNNSNNGEQPQQQQTGDEHSGGGNKQQQQQKKGVPFPKHCRGLVHLALCVAYTGVPFRGLQLQTNEHISHTVEGQLLIGLRAAGYLLPEDFTDDGSKLKTDGGIRIASVEAVAADETAEAAPAAAEDEATVTAPAKEEGNVCEGSASATAVDAADTDTCTPAAARGANAPYFPPHVHKTTVPAHLHGLMSKRQRKKFDPTMNPDGRFNFARACRTDKGVHAVRNIVSLYLREEDWLRDGNEGMMRRINECLPICCECADAAAENKGPTAENGAECSQCGGANSRGGKKMIIQVQSVAPVLPSFNPKDCCSGRTYRYLIPLYALGLPVPPVSTGAEGSGCGNVDASSNTPLPKRYAHSHVTAQMVVDKLLASEEEHQSDEALSSDANAATAPKTITPAAVAEAVESLVSGISPSYFNGAAIVDWERLFAAYPDLLAKGRALAVSGNTNKKKNESSGRQHRTTWLPNASELLRGKSAIVAGAFEKQQQRQKESEAEEEGAPLAQSAVNSNANRGVEIEDEIFDHPLLRQTIEYANHLLHHAYTGPSRRFHNFSATHLDGEALGHRGSSAAKQLKGDDSEASRSIRRCELSPCLVWLRGPFGNEEGGEKETAAEDKEDGAVCDNSKRRRTEGGVVAGEGTCSSSFTIAAEEVRSGTMEFLIGGDYGKADTLTDVDGTAATTKTKSKAIADPAAALYAARQDAFAARGIATMGLGNGDNANNKQQQQSSPASTPLLPFVVFQVEGQSFLLNMIRKLVGFMLAMVRGGRPWWVPELLTLGATKALADMGRPVAAPAAKQEKEGEGVAAEGYSSSALLCHKDLAGVVDFPPTYTPPTLPPPSSSAATTDAVINSGDSFATTTFAERCSFNGFCRPSLLTDAFEPSLFVQTPLAPGPYLALMHSRYTAYDMGVRSMARRSEKKAARDAAVAAAAAEAAAAKLLKEVADDKEVGVDNETAAAPDAATKESAFHPYYHTHVFPISDCWGSRSERTRRSTAALISSVHGRTVVPSALNTVALRDNTEAKTSEKEEKEENSKTEVGSKRPRSSEDRATVAVTSSSSAEQLPHSSVASLADAFYWNVIAHDVAAWDSNVFLTDIDVVLALRDGKRALREAKEKERSNAASDANTGNGEEAAEAKTYSSAADPKCNEEEAAAAADKTSESEETPLELLARLSRPPAITAADAANDRLLNRLRLQTTAPQRCGEMTLFLRSLRLHNWHVKTDEKVAGRLAAQHAQSVKNWEERRARAAAAAAAAAETAANATVGGENDGGALPPPDSNVIAVTAAPVAASGASLPPGSIPPHPLPSHQQQQQHFIPKSALRRQWHHERGHLDELAVAAAMQRILQQQHAAGGGPAADADDENDDAAALLPSGNASDDDDDEANASNNTNNGNRQNQQRGGNNNHHDDRPNNNTNNRNDAEDDLSNYSTFELRDDDGWWYGGASVRSREAHRLLYKRAMVAIVNDRSKSTCRMP